MKHIKQKIIWMWVWMISSILFMYIYPNYFTLFTTTFLSFTFYNTSIVLELKGKDKQSTKQEKE